MHPPSRGANGRSIATAPALTGHNYIQFLSKCAVSRKTSGSAISKKFASPTSAQLDKKGTGHLIFKTPCHGTLELISKMREGKRRRNRCAMYWLGLKSWNKSVMSVYHYTYRVTWSPEDREHVGLCVEFPSLSWLARTPETALKGIRRVVAEAIADMESVGEVKPEPLAEKHYSGEFRVRIPPEVHRALALEAAEQGDSLNRLASAKLAA
jgi:predicted HicB family RNase H-like nuclease